MMILEYKLFSRCKVINGLGYHCYLVIHDKHIAMLVHKVRLYAENIELRFRKSLHHYHPLLPARIVETF